MKAQWPEVPGSSPPPYQACQLVCCSLFESVIPIEDSVVREVTLVLREWGNIWKQLYVIVTSERVRSQDRETYKFSTLSKVMRELLEWRRQLLTGTLTQDHMREFKLKITSKIDWGNSRDVKGWATPETRGCAQLWRGSLTRLYKTRGCAQLWRGSLTRLYKTRGCAQLWRGRDVLPQQMDQQEVPDLDRNNTV
uniref:(California timema) hypothetical protein n=1 Tax=Timema californicum TaxID=61474 RepID=A0A7R9JJM3_TIMCA|nr:unnamed protein product [Timema californicum]